MTLYHLPATGEQHTSAGIYPDWPGETPADWQGVYDEDSNTYVVKAEDVAGATPMTEGQDVGYDYSALVSQPEVP